MPYKIILDRDKLFISNFWQLLTKQLRVKYKLLITVYL
jgi:hypothetical protein